MIRVKIEQYTLIIVVFAVMVGFSATIPKAADNVLKEQSATNQALKIRNDSREGYDVASKKKWSFGRGSSQEDIDRMIEISNSVRNVINALTIDSYLFLPVQNFQIKNFEFKFVEYRSMKERINSGDVLKTENSKEQLRQVLTELEAVCKVLREDWRIDSYEAVKLRCDTVIALMEIEMSEKNITNKVDIVNYMLAKNELLLRGKEPYGDCGYLKEHSVMYMEELLQAYDTTSNRDQKQFIMRQWKVYDLPPALEVELIERLDLNDPNSEPNLSIIVALKYVGGELGRLKIEDFIQNGPATLRPVAARCLENWTSWADTRKRKEREEIEMAEARIIMEKRKAEFKKMKEKRNQSKQEKGSEKGSPIIGSGQTQNTPP